MIKALAKTLGVHVHVLHDIVSDTDLSCSLWSFREHGVYLAFSCYRTITLWAKGKQLLALSYTERAGAPHSEGRRHEDVLDLWWRRDIDKEWSWGVHAEKWVFHFSRDKVHGNFSVVRGKRAQWLESCQCDPHFEPVQDDGRIQNTCTLLICPGQVFQTLPTSWASQSSSWANPEFLTFEGDS